MPCPSIRFSLRTLLILVTIGCCWLGREVEVAHRRVALLVEMREYPSDTDALNTSPCFIAADSPFGQRILKYEGYVPSAKRKSAMESIGWVRRMLGDRPMAIITAPAGRFDEYQDAFPDATVSDDLQETTSVTQANRP